MFQRSLYIRFISVFIGVVLFSILLSYVISSLFFHSEVIFEEEVSSITKGMATLVELAEPETIQEFAETIQTYFFDMIIVDEAGVSVIDDAPEFYLSEEAVQQVFLGKEAPVILPFGSRQETRMVGMPVEIGNEHYALFIHIDYEEQMDAIKEIMIRALLIVLAFGSFMILLASRHLINPIKKLTNAAREMAKGNFSIRLKSKDKDEIGELITSFNHMATEVEKIDKMREDFVSSVSHEIQSPLTSIRGFTKALRDGVIPQENQREYFDIIYKETDRLSRLSDNLLRLSSLESDQHPFHPERYRVDEQIRRIVLATEPQWEQKQLTISLDLHSTWINADEDLFEQVWLNLLNNAIKYSPEKGTISIEVKQEDDYVIVSIQDDGKGIPSEAFPRLFERFYKVDRARTNQMPGNGLGLSIVKKIIDLHQSYIEVESEVGKGSTFTVYISHEE
ncbi:HAMP domain-containing sensor histidine kinase [Alkalihalobacillus sp. LMS39]|uniref:sensor histidine kinase n=1 Tax=Alkalihalobacillus sp. LMS39 TaxID=2924032 RepID=UPI001FB27086|nr:HAMP domain-containing sensor histidine kinase [Alkalihalobacillus sp. LMS39]UOE93090.1 cell wall metabolism sensor histidine kinase WalK [Alkalihalobacillus sp. LMS39]